MKMPKMLPFWMNLRMAALLLAACLALTACSKQRANMALKGAQKRATEARDQYEAQTFAEAEYTGTMERINAAQQAMNQQNFEQALLDAQAASEQSKQLLAVAKERLARDLMEKANKHVQVATSNLGNQIDPTLFQQINDTYTKAQEALANQKYEKTVELCRQIKTDTDTLLQQLQTETLAQLREAKAMLDNFVNHEFGRVEALNYVTDAEAKIAEMERMISYEERQYRQARQVFAEIEATIKKGIHESRRSRCLKAIAELEKRILKAREEQAEIYKPELLASCEDEYKAINENFFSENFLPVLDAAAILEPRLDRLIEETRRLAAQDRINKISNAIASLEADKVREYLPGRLKDLDEMLKQAQGHFAKADYDPTKEIFANAMDEKDRVLADFNDLATKEIQQAQGLLTGAEELLTKMGHIFELQAPPVDDAERMAFENSKQALREDLTHVADDSNVVLAMADVQRRDSQFSDSIDNARQVGRNANFIVHEVYHVLAHNNVMEVMHKAKNAALDGGFPYASEEMKQAQAVLEKARNMIRQNEQAGQPKPNDSYNPDAYKPDVHKTAEAYTEVEVARQRVKHVAANKLKTAEEAVTLAEENKAGVYALGDLATAKQVLQEGEAALAQEELLLAIEKADSAEQIAGKANLKALASWAEEELKVARSAFDRARESGAVNFSTARFQDAESRLSTAQELYQDGQEAASPTQAARHFDESRQLAVSAQEAAREARMGPLTEAEQTIMEARRFNAWEYDYSQVLQAIMDARNAMNALEQKRYGEYYFYAKKATEEAKLASLYGMDATFADRIATLQAELEAAHEGAPQFFLLDELKSLGERLEAIQEKYSHDRFENIQADLDKLEYELTRLVESVPEIFEANLEQQSEIYGALEEKGAEDFASNDMDEAKKRLRHAKIDFENSNYDSAYYNLSRINGLLSGIQMQVQEMEFADNTEEILAEMEEAKTDIRGVLKSSQVAMDISMDYIRRAGGKDTSKIRLAGVDFLAFRRKMDSLYTQTVSMEYPASMYKEYKKLLACVELARASSMSFQKFLILDQYDKKTATDITMRAFEKLAQSRELRNELMRDFDEQDIQGRLARSSRIVGR